MDDAQDVMANARKTVAVAQAMITEMEEKLDETKAMFLVLGMSPQAFLAGLAKYLPAEGVRDVEEDMQSLQAWMKSVIEAAANPSAHPLQNLDLKEVRNKTTPKRYKFV